MMTEGMMKQIRGRYSCSQGVADMSRKQVLVSTLPRRMGRERRRLDTQARAHFSRGPGPVLT